MEFWSGFRDGAKKALEKGGMGKERHGKGCHLQLGKSKPATSAHAAVVFEGRAADDGL